MMQLAMLRVAVDQPKTLDGGMEAVDRLLMKTFVAKRLIAAWCLVALVSCGHLSGVRLPEIGSVGELPPESHTLRIKVTRDGRTFCEGDEVDVAQLSSLIGREVAIRAKSRFEWVECSDLYVLIDADRDVPCGVVGAVLRQLCLPGLAVNQVFFGARSDASGEQGGIALFTPVDLGGSSRDFIYEPFRVAVSMDGGSSTPEALAPILRSWLMDRQSWWEPIIVCECSTEVPLGYALRVVDSILRSGISKVAIDFESHASERQTGDALSYALNVDGTESASVRRSPSIVWGDTAVGRARVELPSVAFARGGFAGVPRPFRIMGLLAPPSPPVEDEQVRIDDGRLPR